MRKMVDVMLEIFRQFFFSMSSDVPAFKVRVFAIAFAGILNWSKWILEVDIPTQILLTNCYPLITLQVVNWKFT